MIVQNLSNPFSCSISKASKISLVNKQRFYCFGTPACLADILYLHKLGCSTTIAKTKPLILTSMSWSTSALFCWSAFSSARHFRSGAIDSGKILWERVRHRHNHFYTGIKSRTTFWPLGIGRALASLNMECKNCACFAFRLVTPTWTFGFCRNVDASGVELKFSHKTQVRS